MMAIILSSYAFHLEHPLNMHGDQNCGSVTGLKENVVDEQALAEVSLHKSPAFIS